MFIINREFPYFPLISPDDHLLEVVGGRLGRGQRELALLQALPRGQLGAGAGRAGREYPEGRPTEHVHRDGLGPRLG